MSASTPAQAYELATNVQLTERIVRLIREMGMEPATPAEARQMIGLSRKEAPVRPLGRRRAAFRDRFP